MGDEASPGVVPLTSGVAYFQSTYNTPTSVFFTKYASGAKVNPQSTHGLFGETVPVSVTTPMTTEATHSDEGVWGNQWGAMGAGVFNNSYFVKPKLVTFKSADGLFDIHAQLFTARPQSGQGEESPTATANSESDGSSALPAGPAVIFTHGGSQRQMYGALHYSPTYAALYALNQYFAYRGVHALSINYRSGVGRGRAFRLCEDPTSKIGGAATTSDAGREAGPVRACGWQGALEYDDVLAGREWLGAQPYVDESRIGVHGLSYGGLNCLQVRTTSSCSIWW
jgi:dipeptidyl aminopeptidase/acylaminoacyl peptidase